jgi:hypothetical protein
MKRNPIEKLASMFFPHRKWVCGACHHRFWAEPLPGSASDSNTGDENT